MPVYQCYKSTFILMAIWCLGFMFNFKLLQQLNYWYEGTKAFSTNFTTLITPRWPIGKWPRFKLCFYSFSSKSSISCNVDLFDVAFFINWSPEHFRSSRRTIQGCVFVHQQKIRIHLSDVNSYIRSFLRISWVHYHTINSKFIRRIELF